MNQEEVKVAVRRLLNTLEAETKGYEKILVLSKQQDDLMIDGDVTAMLPVFTDIQAEIAAIEKMESEIKGCKAIWEEHKDCLPQKVKTAVNEAIANVSDLLQKIITLENEQQETMTQRKEETKKRLHTISQGKAQQKKLHQAYGAGGSGNSRLDQQT